MSKGKIPNISHSKRSSTPKRLLQKERLTSIHFHSFLHSVDQGEILNGSSRWKEATERIFHRHGIGRSPRELRALVQRFSAPQSASVRSVGVTRSWTVRGHHAPLIRLAWLDACLSRLHRWVYTVTRVHTHHLILAKFHRPVS